MKFNKVTFSVIEECSLSFLLKISPFYKKVTVFEMCFERCNFKEAVFNIFQASACYVLDAELKVLKPDTLPPSLRNLTQSLSITNEKALVLILSLHALLKEYIAVGMNDENEIA